MDTNILIFIAVGFIAQLIDGALGMAYKVTSTTILLGIGVPPAAASASTHTASVLTSLVSGLFHLRLGNVDKALVRRLVLPGIVGGVLGAYILTNVPGEAIKPFISLYLLVMGAIILWKALKHNFEERPVTNRLAPLAAFGGLMDALGGGGWGPIVTSNIVARGHNPRLAIGSVNLAEFFVTAAQSLTFIVFIGLNYIEVIVGLLLGGTIAAPVAAFVCRWLPPRRLMIIIGLLIIVLSLRTIFMGSTA